MKRIIVGMSGASGPQYGIRLLEVLKEFDNVETHLVISEAAQKNIQLESDLTVEQVEALADFTYSNTNLAASISSGSFRTEGMVIAPCSVKTLSGLANSFDTNLLIRAGDVTLKEKRKLILIFRETPLHLGHLRLMAQVAEIGATILPPMPAFYHHPKTIQDIVDQTIGKILDQFGLEHQLFCRWKEP
ncbi:MAG: UbiX family flavin prenyltransferase [Pseudomonadota bacterium]